MMVKKFLVGSRAGVMASCSDHQAVKKQSPVDLQRLKVCWNKERKRQDQGAQVGRPRVGVLVHAHTTAPSLRCTWCSKKLKSR